MLGAAGGGRPYAHLRTGRCCWRPRC